MIKKSTILIWILFFCRVSLILGIRNCEFELTLNNDCSPTEYCDEETKQCLCPKGYERFNATYCIPTKKTDDETSKHSSVMENDNSGSVTVYILTPLLIIFFLMGGIYLNRKYHIIIWISKKMHQNNENYDEFMIGQDLDDDDPPLH